MGLQDPVTFSNLIIRGQKDPPDEGLQRAKREKEENKIIRIYLSSSTEPFP